MDDLGKMLGSLGGGTADAGATGAPPELANALGGLLGGQGGLEGLLGQLSSAGLGDQVSSWVGTGPNQRVEPQQLASALGPETVNQLASKSGLDIASLLPMLATFLPTIINALTPHGQVPSGGAAGGAGGGIDIGSILAGLGGSGAGASTPAASSGGSDGSIGDLGKILGGK